MYKTNYKNKDWSTPIWRWITCLLFLTGVWTTDTNAQTITIGTGASTSTAGTTGDPIYRSSAASAFNFSQSVHLLTQAQLSAAGLTTAKDITSMAFYKTTTNTLSAGRTATLKIYMKSSCATALVTTQTLAQWISGATLVYNNTNVLPADLAATGAVTFPFSTNFVYPGVGGIEIAVDWSINTGSGNPTTGSFQWTYNTTTPVQNVGASNSAVITTALSTGNARTYRMNLTLATPAATCFSPACPVGSATSPSTANVSWTAPVPAPGVGYEYAVTTSSTPPASGTPTASTSTSATGLSGNTTYYLHVRSDCGGSGFSTWSTSAPFLTPCNPVAPPYTENFTSLSANYTYPACMTSSPAVGSGAKCQTYIANNVPSTNTALVGRGDTKFSAVYWSPSAASGYFFSAPLTLTAGTSYDASVWYKTDGVAWTDATLYWGTSATTGAMTNTIATVANAAATSYTEIKGSFTVPTTGTYYVAYRAFNSTSSPNYCAFDDFSVVQTPTCLAPTLPTGTATGPTTANISWTAAVPVPSVGYQYAVTTSATPPGSGAATTSTSASVTGLTANTVYYVHVRSECTGPDYSPWVTSATFTTPCNALSIPWSDGFESIATVGTNIYPSCWSYSNITSSNYSCATTCNSNTAHTGTKFIGGSWSFNVWYFTPSFNLTAGTSYDFSYWVKTADAVVGYNLSTFYGTSQTVGAMTNSIGTPVTGYNVASWTKVTATFTPAISGTYYFGLNNNCPTSAPNGIGFDDFALDVTPSCIAPTLPTGTATSTTTANISWTAASPAPSNGYQYAVTTSATPPGSGTAFAGTSTSVTGLTANTAYYVHVRSDCSGIFSPWATSAGTFTTPCNAITSLVSESFNTVGTIPPACWSLGLVNGTVNWTFAAADADAQFTPHSGAAMPVKNWTSAANSDALLISPNLNYSGTYPSTTLRVNVWIYRNATNGLSTDRVAFYANTTNNLSGSPTTLLDIPYAASAAPVVGSSGWYNYTAVIPLSYNSAPFYVIAKGSTTTSFSSYSVGFDDFAIEVAPSCLNPTGLTAGNFTSTTADVSWGSVAGATNYVWELRTSGACGSGSPLQSGTVGSTSVSLSGLSIGTNYTFCVYSDCGGGNLSSTSSFTFALPLPGDGFCNPINLTLGGAQDCKNTTNYTSVGDPQFGGFCSTPNNTVWYTYTPATSGPAYITLSIPSGSGDGLNGWIGLFTATGTCPSLTFTDASGNACVSFGPTAGSSFSYLTPSLTGGTTYYIMMDGVSGDIGDYCIEIDAPPTCFPPTSPIASTSSNNATLSWTCTGCTGTYEVEYGPTGFTQGSGTTIDPATNPTNLTGLAYSTTYDYYVRQDCGAGDWSTWTGPTSFTTGGPPPANDLCSGAITLTCGSTVTGTLLDATLDAGLPVGCGGGNGNYVSSNVWYQIVGNGQNYTVSTCNPGTLISDTKLSVFSGTCGSLVCEDNNDDDGSCSNTLLSTVSFPTQNGVTYYILVHKFSATTTGDVFELSVTCTTCTPSANNDNCATAATLTNGVLLAANNTCAGGAPSNPSCNSFQSAFDVWYKINSGLSTSMQIDLAAVTASGLRYAVYYGSCGSLTSVYCNTTPPASNTITLLGTPADYYIQVWSTSVSTRGDFNLTATLSGGPCMAANANFVSPACAGQNLGLTSNVTFGVGPYSYQWSGTGTFSPSSTSQNPSVTGSATGTYTVTITDNGNPGCSITKTVSVTVNPVPDLSTSGGGVICEGTSLDVGVDNNASGQSSGNSYSWTTNASIPFTSTQEDPTVTGSAALGNSGDYTVVVTNVYGCTSSTSVSATVTPAPTLSVVSQVNVGCVGGSDGELTVVASNGTPSYNYTNDNFVTQNTDGIFTNLPTGPQTIQVQDANSCTGSITATLTAISSTPTTASVTVPFAGMPGTVCSGTTATLSIPAVANATKYTWDASSNAYFNGNTSNVSPFTTSSPSVTVTYTNPTGSFYVTGVAASNGCGAAASSIRKIMKVRGYTSVPASISGSLVACPNTTGSYSTGAIEAATSYLWTITGDATVSGTGTTATVTFGSGFTTGTLCVSSQTSCYTSPAKCITITNTAAALGAISGTFTACPNGTGTFSVPVSAGAATYNWTQPSGSTITSGAGTNSITVSYGASIPVTQVCVSVTSVCGVTSAVKCKTVAPGLPTQPASISGPLSGVCGQTVVYSCPAVAGATSYTWTVPSGASITTGQGTPSISVLFGTFSTGSVCVTANNSCGSSVIRCVPVKGAPNSPGAITATPNCWLANTPGVQFDVATNTLSGSYTLSWSYPVLPVANYQSGGGNSTQLIMDWGTGSGAINVTASNACGSATKSSTWSSSAACRVGASQSATALMVSPNPTTGIVNMSYSASKGAAQVSVTDLAGRVVMSQGVSNVEGMNYQKLDLSKVAKGAYVLQVQTAQGKEQVRVVVE